MISNDLERFGNRSPIEMVKNDLLESKFRAPSKYFFKALLFDMGSQLRVEV